LNPSSDAEKIASGHAWTKHRNEFSDISTVGEFAQHIDNVMRNPSQSKSLFGGRVAFWDEDSGTLVIRDPNNSDLGTAFKPNGGKAYYDNLR
jgi:filamentous hemagglutinin